MAKLTQEVAKKKNEMKGKSFFLFINRKRDGGWSFGLSFLSNLEI
jgi:hypothetical protein